jgi:hypothetical protein
MFTPQVIATTCAVSYNRDSTTSSRPMRYVVPAVLLVVAAIHALPVIGILGASQLSRLYGLPVNDANLELVLRHRALLFGLLAAFLSYAAFKPELHRLALVAGVASVSSFLVLAALVGPYNQAIATVVRVDWVALALLVVAAVVHLQPR